MPQLIEGGSLLNLQNDLQNITKEIQASKIWQ
jgi:hypothetical protein